MGDDTLETLDAANDFIPKLLKFVILLEQWPWRMAWVLKFIENVQQNRLNMELMARSNRTDLQERAKAHNTRAAQREEEMRWKDDYPVAFIYMEAMLYSEPRLTFEDLCSHAYSSEGDDPTSLLLRLPAYAFNISPGIIAKVSDYLDDLEWEIQWEGDEAPNVQVRMKGTEAPPELAPALQIPPIMPTHPTSAASSELPVSTQLKDLAELKTQGFLSEVEFAAAKSKILEAH